MLIEQNVGHIADRRVLDVGSHDGRWSFAALRNGAQSVTGVEPRQDLVELARESFDLYEQDRSRFAFHIGDILEVLDAERPEVDTVFLFGVLYHVNYHVWLLRELCKTGASTMIVDTHITPHFGEGSYYDATISLIAEPINHFLNTHEELFPGAGRGIVGHPSRPAVCFLLEQFGFTVTEADWPTVLLRYGSEGLEDYAGDERTTFLAAR